MLDIFLIDGVARKWLQEPPMVMISDLGYTVKREANRRGFLVHRNSRNFGRLARRSAVCEQNSGRSPAFCA